MSSFKTIQYRCAAVLLLLALACCGIKAQVPFTAIPYKNDARNGNKQFSGGNYGEAEINYRKALEKNDSMPQAQFNLGDALYKEAEYDTAGRQKRLDEAINQFQHSAQSSNDKVRAEAYHNIGNAYLGQQKWEDAVNAYKNALKINPSDPDTKYNLAYANAQILKQKQQQQKNQQNKNKNDKKEQKKDQQNKDENKSKQDKGKDQQAKQGDKKDQQAQPQKAKLSKEEAEKLLQAIANEEKKTNQKVQQKQVKPVYGKPEKDW